MTVFCITAVTLYYFTYQLIIYDDDVFMGFLNLESTCALL